MAQKISMLPVGAKVRDVQTTYYDTAIDWVIGDKNHEGYPTNSVTLVSEYILTIKTFDAKESGGSTERVENGNNRYSYANIRQWLNKAGTGWYVKQHTYDRPPAASYVYHGENAYDTEAGFKTGFSNNMLVNILPTTLIVGKCVADNYGTETCIDDIFLLSSDEVGLGTVCDAAEGVVLAMFSDNDSRKCMSTEKAVSESEYKDNALKACEAWNWSLRTPARNKSYSVICVGRDGMASTMTADMPRSGIRPSLNLSAETWVSDIPDAEGYYTIIWGAAPTIPPGITVPESVQGGTSLNITYGASTDPDDNPVGYELERQVDGGDWTQVYKGEATSYTDAITRGWETVAYRVRAYDSLGLTSDYATSPTREVNNNRAPAIACTPASGSDLGVKGEGFTIAYSTTDADGDSVTVTEAIDGVTLRTFTPEGEGACTCALTGETWMKILNGAHELAITAGDGQAQAVHTLAFTKSVTAASVTLAQPMEADGPITLCVLSVTGSIPEDADYGVKVTNNALDGAPVWEDCTDEVKLGANHVFTNDTAANGFAFNFKVEVERGESGQGGYINSVQGGFQ